MTKVDSQAYMEIESMMQHKPISNSNNKMAETYNKMKDISHKYGKLVNI